MNDLFKKDITIKIISVALAIIFWLYVSNIANPFTTKTFYNIPVIIENENYLSESGYRVINELRYSVDVTIRGRQEAVDKIRTSDFETTLDYSQIRSVNDKKMVITEPVCMQKGVTIISYSPVAIDIQLARNKSGTFPVELKQNVTMKPGFVLLETTVSPENVPIFNEESLIDSVSSIVANLDIKDLDRDTTKQIQCKAYNKAGKEIESLSNGLIVNVKLTVAKEVPVSLVTRGRLAADYIETLRVIDPIKALITGSVEVLEGITGIKTDQVDIDKIDGNFTASVPLIVPEGVKLVNTPKEINVNINVEKLVLKDIELVNNDISILNATNDGSLIYEIKTEKLMLQLKGRQADVNAIRLENLKPAVDVTGLLEGSHKLPLYITIPPQVKLMQQANVEIKITKTVVTQEPQGPLQGP